jgi:hypothetical protein
MKKSIMFDVLNVIDGACKNSFEACEMKEYSLLKKDTYNQYNHIFELARKYDDSIAAAMYIPESQSPEDKYTVLYKVLVFDKMINFSSYEDLIKFIENLDRETGTELIMKYCLYMEQKAIPEDFIPSIIRSQNMFSISLFNDTKLPQKIKFSLATLIFNYKRFLSELVNYLNKIYEAVKDLYEKHRENYRYSSKLLREYLKVSSAEMLLSFDTQEKLFLSNTTRKYILVVSMLRLEYGLVAYDNNKAIFIKGVFSIQRILHDINFKIF